MAIVEGRGPAAEKRSKTEAADDSYPDTSYDEHIVWILHDPR